MESIHSFAQAHAVFLSGLILILAYIFIATEKISKVTVALIGACAAIFLGLVSQDKTAGGAANAHYYINYIDFNVIFLLISMMIIVSIAAKSGIFNYAAVKLLSLTRGRPIFILPALAFFTAFVSAFLDNVTTVILVMPMTFAIAEKLDINPVPFLIAEIFSSNIGGTATLIGDPPNIIIGSAANLSFMDFINELTPIVAIIMVAVCAFLMFAFRKSLVASEDKIAELVRSGGKEKCVTDVSCAVRSIVVLGLVIIVGALEASGGIKMMADAILDATHGSQSATSMIILWGSGIISGVIDNIPYTATMAPMILEIEKVMGAEYAHPLWWSLSLGACLGGNMTIIGAAANVIVSENSAKHGHKITFMYFFKYGVIVTGISLAISAVCLWFKFFI